MEIVKGTLDEAKMAYEAKIEDGKLKVTAELDIAALIDKGVELIPGNSPVEQMVATLLKTALKAV